VNYDRKRKHSSRHGFTLIEIILVIGIISALMSVAIPGFYGLVWATKRSETDTMMRNISQAMIEYISQNERFPQDMGGGVTTLTANYNPPLPVTGAKKQFLPNQPGWTLLSWEPSTYLYYHYYVYGYTSPGVSYFYVQAGSDLDGNGVIGWRKQTYQRNGLDWNMTQDVVFPLGEW
jgi:prepilin-type N-terminal cleavage/methylation domain-containing protein